ncbi:hypothetical protein BDA96_07G208400 [Sorghum bicolor]|uniref:Ubiquitinyl hydrolase 1 n=1 Tax=Sorghum bicolor TaxID=4558 RepID=A0A921QQ85_SORBI|nr:hypothetical protein BDA96_07G208400 [Sorghum bicolor]
MGDMRPRPWEADESSRSRDSKAPRLDLLATTATATTEVDDLLGSRREDCPELTGNHHDDRCCDHVPIDSAHKDILSLSLLSDDAGICKDCSREEEASGQPKYHRILVCLECGRHSCGDLRSYLLYGHARDHARQEQHWVATLFDDPQTGLCFKCECERPVYPEPDDELGMIFNEIKADGSGHVFGFNMPCDLATELLNLRDAWQWHAAELISANAQEQGYAIKGMPNCGNTCYMNAMVQCLLALDKLRARMLGPDPPPGDIGMALRELFVEVSTIDSAGGLRNPDKLLRIVRLYASKYEGYKMHDSYELLESLRNALQDEENGIETPCRERGGDPTVVDSIFRGELFERRSCIYCQSASTFHGYFWDLSLSLPSKENLSKSLKSQQKKTTTELLSVNMSNLGKINAKSGDSHLLVSELNDLVVDKTSDHMEVDYAKEQHTWQSKDVIVHDPLCTEEPLYSAGFVPHSISDAKVEQMIHMTIDSPYREDIGQPPPIALLKHDSWMTSCNYVDHNGKGIGDSNCILTIEDCLSLFFKEEVIERSCDCSKVPMDPKVGTNDGVATDRGHTEQSYMTTCPNRQSSELNSLFVECKSSYYRQQDGYDGECEIIQMADTNTIGANSRMSCGHKETEYQEVACCFLSNEKQANLLTIQHNHNLIPPNQDLRKQVGLDLSANMLGDNQYEQKERSGRAIQKPHIMKLPPVLTLHLKRYIKNGNEYHKNEAHVMFKEVLDVGRFMDSRYLVLHITK